MAYDQSMGTFLTANELAILSSGINAEWSDQSGTGLPADLAAGKTMLESIVALVKIDLRESLAFRTSRVQALAFDAGDTYTITLNGTAHAVATPASLDALMVAWETAINAGAQAGVLTALATNDAGVAAPGLNTTVLITGDIEADYSLGVLVTGGGAGTINATADPSSAVARLYGLNNPAGATGTWSNVRWPKTDLIDLPVERRGFTERLEVASFPRMAVELADVFGAGDGIPGASATLTYVPRVQWGPSVISAN